MMDYVELEVDGRLWKAGYHLDGGDVTVYWHRDSNMALGGSMEVPLDQLLLIRLAERDDIDPESE